MTTGREVHSLGAPSEGRAEPGASYGAFDPRAVVQCFGYHMVVGHLHPPEHSHPHYSSARHSTAGSKQGATSCVGSREVPTQLDCLGLEQGQGQGRGRGSCGLQVAGCAVAGCGLQVAGCGLRVAGAPGAG